MCLMITNLRTILRWWMSSHGNVFTFCSRIPRVTSCLPIVMGSGISPLLRVLLLTPRSRLLWYTLTELTTFPRTKKKGGPRYENGQQTTPPTEWAAGDKALWLALRSSQQDFTIGGYTGRLFQFPDLLEDSSFFDEEEKTLVRFVFSRILSLSFITQKHLEEIEEFYEEYNN